MQALDQHYIVHKVGGSSLAQADRFIALKSLFSGDHEIIVVSAVQDVTTALQTILDLAKAGDAYLPLLDQLEKKHVAIAHAILTPAKYAATMQLIQKDFVEIKEILHSVQLTGSYAADIQDFILGYGELWSATILTEYLAEFHRVVYLDASKVIFVSEQHGMKCIDWERSQAALNLFLRDKTFDQMVITGFIASTLDGKRTTLGRNGSDFSAAIFAKLFKAQSLTLWTDVDGIYTADPNKVRSAFVIEALSYKEALELAYFGAKVLHPMTIAPVLECQIPIYIKNSFNPAAPGTYISAATKKSPHLIKGLSCIDDIALINIEGSGMIGVSGIAARVFGILHEAGVSVILISQASSEHSICFAVSNKHADIAVLALNEHLKFEIERKQIEGVYADKNCVILSAVGDEMIGTVGISDKLCHSLARANVNIRAMSQGSSERNISLVIKNTDMNRAMRAVHAGFYLSRATISIGLIGPGLIGGTLLNQIHAALEHLKLTDHVNLYVRGIMSSQKMLLSHGPIELNDWHEQFTACHKPANLAEFTQHILSDDVPHAVIIDCTANETIAKHYLDFLQKGIHVITPNKQANSGDLQYYQKIQALTQKSNIHYLYETTVCAGLPVITTLQDILKTGDEVIKIEGIVSGTLSYIFNELAKGKTFSQVVLEAKAKGYTEPDPRQDLSGMDVARKLVCLAREMGHDVTLQDVKVHDLVPAELRTCSIETFLEKLPAYDESMQTMIATAHAKHEQLCYVGMIDQQGKVNVAIQAFPSDHPFARLKGTDNMLIFHTRRYHENPLIIQGPGAGAEVTAAGIFADLLRLVSFLS